MDERSTINVILRKPLCYDAIASICNHFSGREEYDVYVVNFSLSNLLHLI